MNLSYEFVGQQAVTFAAQSGVNAGTVCGICANDTVGKLSAGDAFCGYVLDVAKDGAACVALHGYVQLPYSGDAPALGWSGLCADGSGGVKADDTGKSYLVIHVDTADGTVGFFL